MSTNYAQFILVETLFTITFGCAVVFNIIAVVSNNICRGFRDVRRQDVLPPLNPKCLLCPLPAKMGCLSTPLHERGCAYEPMRGDLRWVFLRPSLNLPESPFVALRCSQGVHLLRISAGGAEKRDEEYGRTKCGESRLGVPSRDR
jgi:hypothetical protein